MVPPVLGMQSSVLNTFSVRGICLTLLSSWSSSCGENAGDAEEGESSEYERSSLKPSRLQVRGLKVSHCSMSIDDGKDSQARYCAALKRNKAHYVNHLLLPLFFSYCTKTRCRLQEACDA